MSQPIRVARLGELPPGKGKVVEIEGRSVTIYNREGRFVATSTRAPHPHLGDAVDCTQHGMLFEACAEDSPARLHADEPCRVWVDGEDVWMVLD